jgi:hypothetical protein
MVGLDVPSLSSDAKGRNARHAEGNWAMIRISIGYKQLSFSARNKDASMALAIRAFDPFQRR